MKASLLPAVRNDHILPWMYELPESHKYLNHEHTTYDHFFARPGFSSLYAPVTFSECPTSQCCTVRFDAGPELLRPFMSREMDLFESCTFYRIDVFVDRVT